MNCFIQNLTFLVKYNESELGIVGTNGLASAFLSPQVTYSSIYTFGSELQQPALTSIAAFEIVKPKAYINLY